MSTDLLEAVDLLRRWDEAWERGTRHPYIDARRFLERFDAAAARKLTHTPEAWKDKPEDWWEHVEACLDCSRHYARPAAVSTEPHRAPEMISPRCDRCKNELTDFGALVFSPPRQGTCTKWHVCKSCWDDLTLWFLKAPAAGSTEPQP